MGRAGAVLVTALVLVADASACSCAPVDLERDLPRADGAFIGTVLERRVEGDRAVYLFRAEQVYKGDISNRVEIETAASGAACGLELGVGDRTGLLLTREGGTWTSGLCSEVDPSDLLALTDVEDAALPPLNWGGIVVGAYVLLAGAFGLFLAGRMVVVRIRGTTAEAKIRHPLAVLGLVLLTLGIYHYPWYYQVNNELRGLGRAAGDEELLGRRPLMSLLAITVGWLILIPPFVSFYKTFQRIGAAQELSGTGQRVNVWLGFALFLVFLPVGMVYAQSELNRVWQADKH